jgi:hypothetical protein
VIAACAVAAGAFLAAPQGEPQSLARLSSIPMERGFRVEELLTMDVDGDDVADVVVQSIGPTARRLAVHLRRASGPAFVGVPDAALDLPPDVVCFAAADVAADRGREIVLMTATGA